MQLDGVLRRRAHRSSSDARCARTPSLALASLLGWRSTVNLVRSRSRPSIFGCRAESERLQGREWGWGPAAGCSYRVAMWDARSGCAGR